ncbi:aldehyde dehydrogenase (NADP(+)) [Amycolatopsis magusensis]|uniref:aldehyde dehydrogenase (NADP(+)) n=1 Tax=Amycolatopsis magusensis TaxID=882444 RepID=UPI0024A94F9F|nr:aldehyde dehydrogenase (NADP(+)) [Amycolatopsis magusensis]MDI5975464.1 aldehyde dehydrogenase (NADP(+)) [Amycolatopsis magusensis]
MPADTLRAATVAARELADWPPDRLAKALHLVADALAAAGDKLVPIAARESNLPVPRLEGELGRTVFQFRLLAGEVTGERYREPVVDRADPDWPAGGRPDLRRLLRPIGPVLVFGASNFPFAFSVAGGDTASALAAGCPVIHKGHPGHPELAEATAAVVSAALGRAGAPEGTFSLLRGEEAARSALQAPEVKAAAFTGSPAGGRALYALAASRPDPIPFYAEMGSVNPVFVTPGAAAARHAEIAAGYTDSYLLGAGQFCTKPGILFYPAAALPEFEAAVADRVRGQAAATLLNDRIAQAHSHRRAELVAHPAVRVVAPGTDTPDGTRAALLATTLPELRAAGEVLLAECFGPTSLLVAYDGEHELLAAARLFTGELTATVHGEAGEQVARPLVRRLAEFAGRVVWNGWPTGVAVTHAQHHGGPAPAATGTFTSVGTAAIRRFLRPVAYQNLPGELLPPPLRDHDHG